MAKTPKASAMKAAATRKRNREAREEKAAQETWEQERERDNYFHRKRCHCKGPWGRTKAPNPVCPDCAGTGWVKTFEPLCGDCYGGYEWKGGNEPGYYLCECQRKRLAVVAARERGDKNHRQFMRDHEKSIAAITLFMTLRSGTYKPRRRRER